MASKIIKATGQHGSRKSLVAYGKEETDRRKKGTCIHAETSTIWARKTKCGTVTPSPASIQRYNFIIHVM